MKTTMNCPKCGNSSGVSETRTAPNNRLRRRRTCLKCRFKFTTYEVMAAKESEFNEAVADLKYAFTKLKSVVNNATQ